MLEQLAELDKVIFFLINVKWTHSLLDFLLPLARNKFIWMPLYIFLGSFLLINFRRNGVMVILYLLLTIFITDQLSSSILKPFFERIRPCNDTIFRKYINLLVQCGSGYSFPSTHATNHFAVAQFVGIIFWRLGRAILPIAWLWAFIVSYAQIYVGVHFPLDIIAGLLIGLTIGTVMALLWKRYSGW